MGSPLHLVHKKHYTCTLSCHYFSVVLLTVYNIVLINFENIFFYCNHILQIVMLLIFVALIVFIIQLLDFSSIKSS